MKKGATMKKIAVSLWVLSLVPASALTAFAPRFGQPSDVHKQILNAEEIRIH
jgi:hypothetical protein